MKRTYLVWDIGDAPAVLVPFGQTMRTGSACSSWTRTSASRARKPVM
jgi:hypothetical protein